MEGHQSFNVCLFICVKVEREHCFHILQVFYVTVNDREHRIHLVAKEIG